jgi:hypothetical protein
MTAVHSDTARYPRTLSLQSSDGKWFINGTVRKQEVQVYLIEE